jgi:tetratricopeptide (TPR) repeat protein
MPWWSRGRGTAGPDRDARAEKLFGQGQQELDAGRLDAAVATFRQVVKLTPDSPNSQFLLGAALFKAGDSEAAVAPLRQCIAMRPEHPEAHLVLGMSLGRLGRFDEAEDHMARAASLGDRQARELLPELGIDLCHTCERPVRFGRGSDADIVVMGPRMGVTCADCHTVRCAPCANRGRFGVMQRDCPDCGGPLRLLTR